jgi:hypothetical protein
MNIRSFSAATLNHKTCYLIRLALGSPVVTLGTSRCPTFQNSAHKVYLCVLCGSQKKQRLLAYEILTDWFCITEVENVYCVVRAESLYKTDTFRL